MFRPAVMKIAWLKVKNSEVIVTARIPNTMKSEEQKRKAFGNLRIENILLSLLVSLLLVLY